MFMDMCVLYSCLAVFAVTNLCHQNTTSVWCGSSLIKKTSGCVTSCGKVIFSQACVILSSEGRRCTPRGRHPFPWADTPPDSHCSGQYASGVSAWGVFLLPHMPPFTMHTPFAMHAPWPHTPHL